MLKTKLIIRIVIQKREEKEKHAYRSNLLIFSTRVENHMIQQSKLNHIDQT